MRKLIPALGLLLVLAPFIPVTVFEPISAEAGDQQVDRPKLVVMIVFDQMRGDYLSKWQPLFKEGGFKRLQQDGAWFTNCHYPYAYTITAPGHTSLMTGTSPYKHGIVANDWYDRENRDTITSVTPPPDKVRSGRGPYRRRVQVLGDVLIDLLMGKCKVFSFSIKDRSAILMAASKANGVYWFDNKKGKFMTSAFYRDEEHEFAKAFNRSNFVEKWLGTDWNRFDPNLDYAKHSGPDDFAAEGIGYEQGQTFPHPFKLGSKAATAKEVYYSAVENSPAGNELLLTFAKAAIVAEKLGQTDTTDLLTLSFSSNDLVGHCWGPDSQEVLDITLRSDALIKNLLDFLDTKVGKGKYVVALSADHGVCPLPEFSKKGDRVVPELLTTRAEAFLNATFLGEGKKTIWFEAVKKQNPWVYLNHATMKELGLEQSKVERAMADWLNGQPGVERAFTRTEMMAGGVADSPIFESVRKSFYASQSGDVMVILKPYHLFSPPLLSTNPEKNAAFRTSHGTPHPYDTHVPLLVMGPRVIAGNRDERIAPQSIAAILADLLRIPAPKGADYSTPAGLIAK